MYHYFFCGLFFHHVLMLLVLLGLVACGGDGKSVLRSSSSLASPSSISNAPSSSPNSSSLASSAPALSSFLMGGAIQEHALNITGVVSTFAGVAGINGSADGTGATAAFLNPNAITTDGTNLYVADTVNDTIRQIAIATGAVTTLAGTAGINGSADGIGAAASFDGPSGITTDGINLYTVDTNNHIIRKIVIATGAVTTLAGTAGVNGQADGLATMANFDYPSAITTDGTNLYVTDYGTIRTIVIESGAVSTLAGAAGVRGGADGIGTAASFYYPIGITTDGNNLYVLDTFNSTIRKIVIATGKVTTLAGTAGVSGYANDTGAAASFRHPRGITTDGTNLYVADTDNSTIRQIVIATGVATTLAGTAGVRGGADGTGAAASFSYPYGITTDGTSIYVADTDNNIIRKIDSSSPNSSSLASSSSGSTVAPFMMGGAIQGNPLNIATDVSTLASLYSESNGAEEYSELAGITTDGTNLYVTSRFAHTIQQIVIATGEVTTLASIPTPSYAYAAAIAQHPNGITTDGTNLYVADTFSNSIRQVVIATGEVTTLAGVSGESGGSADGKGATASFTRPGGITTDGTNLYVTDTANAIIRKIVIATGEVTTLAGTAQVLGRTNATGAAASFLSPTAITTDGTNLYVVDSDYWSPLALFNPKWHIPHAAIIRKVVIATGAVTTFYGEESPGFSGRVRDITTDGTSLYMTDASYTIRKIVIATGADTTLVGTLGVRGGVDGVGTTASFNGPQGITTDGIDLFVTDYTSIRKIH
ncbi:MAG: hypothetical protein V4732_22925 [Pseudomonadota bacterium]